MAQPRSRLIALAGRDWNRAPRMAARQLVATRRGERHVRTIFRFSASRFTHGVRIALRREDFQMMRLALLLAVLATACGLDWPAASRGDSLGPEVTRRGPLHRPGQPCLWC